MAKRPVDEVVSISEAAAMAGVSEETIRREVLGGSLKSSARKIGKGRKAVWVISKSAAEAYARSRN